MKAKYYIIMFALCFFVWVILVDNAVLPNTDSLRKDYGVFTRYRVKEWNKGRKWDVVQDELLVYAIVKDREQLYYMERTPYFEATLKNLPEMTPVELGYVNRFPKFWKRELYDVSANGRSIMTYSPAYLLQEQQKIWKISGIMAGIYGVLVILGLLNKPRRS